MRSLLAIIIFCVATFVVVLSQAQTRAPSLSNPYQKQCGKLRSDFKYTYDETSEEVQKSQVELCLDVTDHGVQCGVSSDPLLMSSLNLLVTLQAPEICMKFDSSTSPQRIISVQGK